MLRVPRHGSIARFLTLLSDGRFLLSVTVLATACLLVVRAGDQLHAANARLLESRLHATQHLKSLVDQEVGLRAFLATGDGRFLQPYEEGRIQERVAFEHLRADVAGSAPAVREAVERLGQETRRWQEEVAQAQMRARAQAPLADLPAALILGKQRFDGIRAASAEAVREHELETQAAIESGEAHVRGAWMGALLAAAAVFVIGILLRQWMVGHIVEPLRALSAAAERNTAFRQDDGTAFELDEVTALSTALEALRERVGDRERRLEEQRAEARELAVFAEHAQQCGDESELLDLLGAAVQRAAGLEAQILLRNASENRLEPAWPRGLRLMPSENPILLDPMRCRTVRSGHLVQLGGKDLAFACRCPAGAVQQGSYTCLPLIAAGNVIGLVNLRSTEPGFFDAERMRVLQSLVGHAGTSLGAIRLLRLARNHALHDALTGAYNRRALNEFLPRMLSLAQRTSRPLAVLMLDIDHFKRFNDEHGHEIGDRVLASFAQSLREQMRDSDVLVRWGGEEFLAILPETDAAGARSMAERARVAVEALRSRSATGAPLQITCSVGVSAFPTNAVDGDGLVSAADRALYQAKHAGRNCVIVSEGPQPQLAA